jgi:hypothetical protein
VRYPSDEHGEGQDDKNGDAVGNRYADAIGVGWGMTGSMVDCRIWRGSQCDALQMSMMRDKIKMMMQLGIDMQM